jgi:branched-chain amino acid transport system permease protein
MKMPRMQVGTRIAAVAAFLISVFVVVPAIIAATHRTDLYYTLSSVALLSIASAGVWLTFYIGRINIGQAAFSLVGGYVSAILVTTYGFSFWFSLPIAGLFCAAASILVGVPILRLRGVYFAMVTLVLTEVARLSALALSVTNGAKGITNIPPPGPIRLLGLTIVPPFDTFSERNAAFYFLSVALMVLCFAALWRLVNSRIGRLFAALRQNEDLASSMGLNVPALRVLAYAISSFLGGVGGAIFVAIAQSIYPSSFTVNDSVNFMLNCFLGGLGYVFGPMLGTLVLYFGWDLLFSAGQYQLLIYSGVMILLILLLPNGLLSVRLPARRRS